MKRRDITGNLVLVLLERHENARFVEINGAVDQEGEREQRLAGSRAAADERRPSRRQPAARDLVEPTDPVRVLDSPDRLFRLMRYSHMADRIRAVQYETESDSRVQPSRAVRNIARGPSRGMMRS